MTQTTRTSTKPAAKAEKKPEAPALAVVKPEVAAALHLQYAVLDTDAKPVIKFYSLAAGTPIIHAHIEDRLEAINLIHLKILSMPKGVQTVSYADGQQRPEPKPPTPKPEAKDDAKSDAQAPARTPEPATRDAARPDTALGGDKLPAVKDGICTGCGKPRTGKLGTDICDCLPF